MRDRIREDVDALQARCAFGPGRSTDVREQLLKFGLIDVETSSYAQKAHVVVLASDNIVDEIVCDGC